MPAPSLFIQSLTAVALAFTMVVPQVTPAAAAEPTRSSDTRRMTTIRLVFDTCPGCTVTANWTVVDASGKRTYDVRKWRAPVRGNVARFRVPTWATVGMSFTVVSDPWWGALGGGNAVPVIAMGFVGTPVGTRVSKAVPTGGDARGNWCWAGTTARRFTIKVSSFRTIAKVTYPDEQPRQVAYWASPSLPTFKDEVNATTGMGTQQSPWCLDEKVSG